MFKDMSRRFYPLLCLFLLPALACKPKPPPPTAVTTYTGPLMATPQLVAALSENSRPLRTLWARHDFSVSFLDDNGKVRSFDGDGVLLIRKPPAGSPSGTPVELRLQGSKDVMGQVFDVGANKERAWLTLLADIDTMYWLAQGAEIPPAGPGKPNIPVRPDLIADVLGIADVPTNLAGYPTPVMRFESAADAYVLMFVEPSQEETHLVTRRELWVDRSTLRVTKVLLFAPDGRLAVQSDLAKHEPLSGTATTQRSTLVPTDITLTFPQSRTTMRLTLRSLQPSRNNLPSDVSFKFPTPPPVPKVIRLDQR